MKKLLLLVSALLITATVFGQDSYTASNGHTYKVGDTIKMAKGSGISDTFVYLRVNTMTPDEIPIGTRNRFTNTNVIIKKIRTIKVNGSVRTIFVVNPYRVWLEIEPALEAKEVKQ